MKEIKDIYYIEDNNPSHTLDIYLPESDSFKVFLYFHGGGLEKGKKGAAKVFTEGFIKNNIAVVSAEYRMYPYAGYPDFIKDAAAAVSWVFKNMESYGNIEGIYVGGSSAGGYLSEMLCFDKKYLSPFGLTPMDISGFIHDAGQPTTHFNVLRERGIDPKRVIIDEAAPIYHIGKDKEYPPMLIFVSDNDMPGRLEQTHLLMATLKHFEYDLSKVQLSLMENFRHCGYLKPLETGENLFVNIASEFIKKN